MFGIFGNKLLFPVNHTIALMIKYDTVKWILGCYNGLSGVGVLLAFHYSLFK